MAKQQKQNQATIGYINNYAGTVVSLDMRKSTYFGVGKTETGFKLWLSKANWCDTIPEGLSDEEVRTIELALQGGVIVMGEHWIPSVEKDKTVLAKYMELSRKPLSEANKKPFRDLVLKKKEGGYTAQEILEYVSSVETKTTKRIPWLIFLKAGIDTYEGPVQLVQDFPDDPLNKRVSIDRTSNSVVSEEFINQSMRTDFKVPFDGNVIVSDEEKEQAINEYLGN